MTSEDLLIADRALQQMLDRDTTFHVTMHRDWFSSFASSKMLGLVHLQDGSVHAIAGSGDFRLSLPSGALLVL